MSLKTPFFRAFGPLLFGRQAGAVQDRLRRFDCLEDVYGALGDLFPEKMLDPANIGTNSRRRCLPPVVTFWAFVAQVLSPKTSCREITHRIEVWWRWANLRIRPGLTASAYCQGRQRLRLETLQLINHHLAWNLERGVLNAERPLAGRDVKIIDATHVSLPDTPENQAIWPQPSGQKTGCGFPILKMAGLFSLASGALLVNAVGPHREHEGSLFRRLWFTLKKGDVILGDRLYCSWCEMAALGQRGIDSVVRLHQFRPTDARGQRLGEGDRLVRWERPKTCPKTWSREDFALLPAELSVRLITIKITAPGFRPEEITLATTLVDPELYPADTLRALYARRWDIELHFAQLKTTLQMDTLRCQSPQMIEKELEIHLIAYNLVRSLMQKAAQLHHVPLGRLSFKASLDFLRHAAAAIQASARTPRKQQALIDDLLAAIAREQVPKRPGRSEPRARKRRPKNYQLLTKPRAEMKVIPHREKYRAPRPKSPLS